MHSPMYTGLNFKCTWLFQMTDNQTMKYFAVWDELPHKLTKLYTRQQKIMCSVISSWKIRDCKDMVMCAVSTRQLSGNSPSSTRWLCVQCQLDNCQATRLSSTRWICMLCQLDNSTELAFHQLDDSKAVVGLTSSAQFTRSYEQLQS